MPRAEPRSCLVGVTGRASRRSPAQHFKPTEVISSDFCRGLVADDENDQSATPDAFELLQFIVGKRLAAGRLTVIDATNVQPEARKPLVDAGPRARRAPGGHRPRPAGGLCVARGTPAGRTATSART